MMIEYSEHIAANNLIQEKFWKHPCKLNEYAFDFLLRVYQWKVYEPRAILARKTKKIV